MNYTVVSTVAENRTSLFPLAVGSSLNNESNFLKIKFTVERNNVFHRSCTLCFFFGLHSMAYTWLCISCLVLERSLSLLSKEQTLYSPYQTVKKYHILF